MMIRMVVTKANSRDNLNCGFDDRYYDEADDGDGPTLNGSGSPSLNKSLARWLLASQVSRRSGLYYQHLLYIYKIIKGWCRRKRRFAKVLVFCDGSNFLSAPAQLQREKSNFFQTTARLERWFFSVHHKAKMVREEWSSWATSTFGRCYHSIQTILLAWS